MNDDGLPDNVAPHPESLPYPTNIGSPVIKPDHSVSGWKHAALHDINKHYKEKYDDLKKQFEQFAQEFEWNQLMFKADMRIKPVIGNVYHLYRRNDSQNYVSLFAPDERAGGYDDYIGSFRLNHHNRWEKI